MIDTRFGGQLDARINQCIDPRTDGPPGSSRAPEGPQSYSYRGQGTINIVGDSGDDAWGHVEACGKSPVSEDRPRTGSRLATDFSPRIRYPVKLPIIPLRGLRYLTNAL